MKKFDIKSMVMGIIIGVGLVGGIAGAATYAVQNVYFSQYPIVINGTRYYASLPTLSYSNRTYVPLNELATMTGASVNFTNDTIYINSANASNNYTNNYNNPYNYYDGYNNYGNTKREIDLDVDDTESIYVNLGGNNSGSARIKYDSSYVKLSQTIFTQSGIAIITGKSEGLTTLNVIYDSGNIDVVEINVNDDEKDDELEIEVDDYDYIYVDLEDYDADKATLSVVSGSSYVDLAKTSVTSSQKVKIYGEEEGDAKVKIKYDTGDYEYIYVEVTDDDYDDELEIEVDDYDYIYVDLEDYDADEATLSIVSGSSYVDLAKTFVTSSQKVKVYGEEEGDAKIKIKYDTGDYEYIYVEVYE